MRTILPCDNGIRYIAIHSHLFGLAQIIPYVNRFGLVQCLQSHVAVFYLKIFLPFFIMNRIENRRRIYCEAVATVGCHIACLKNYKTEKYFLAYFFSLFLIFLFYLWSEYVIISKSVIFFKKRLILILLKETRVIMK